MSNGAPCEQCAADERRRLIIVAALALTLGAAGAFVVLAELGRRTEPAPAPA